MKDYKSLILKIAARIILGGILMVFLTQLMMLDALKTDVEIKFMESTYTEWAQQVILFLMAALFAHSAYHYRKWRGLSLLLAGISLAGLIREYNNFFNEQVFDGAWQLLVLLVVLTTWYLVRKYRKDFWKDVEGFFGSMSFGFLLAGFLTTFIFSRLFGKTRFWEAIMEDQYFRSVKNAAEECIELLGYGLLLIAAVEYFYLVKKEKKLKPPV